MQRRTIRSPFRRVLRPLAATMALAAVLTMLSALAGPGPTGPGPASAQEPGTATSGDVPACPADPDSVPAGDSVVDVIKVSGLIDPVTADAITTNLARAERDGAVGYVLWLNSRGSVLSSSDYLALATALEEAAVPIAVWVGPSGSTARGGAAELIGVADIVGVSPGASVGATGPARLPDRFGPAFGDATGRLETSIIPADDAVSLGISVGPLSDTALIGAFLTNLPGFETYRCVDTAASATASSVPPPGGSAIDGPSGLRTYPITQTRLTGLSLPDQLFHTVASPEVAYLLFGMGLALIVFELFTAGVGVAGIIGAGFTALGCYGLAVLPTRGWAVVLLVLAFLALAVDIQTNVPRLYTPVGIALFTIGTLFLYNDGVAMSWVTKIAGIVGIILYAYAGMPSMVRTRFSTPTIGRSWMIGEMGEAVTDVNPDGTVRVRDVTWRAVTNRATPIRTGERIRVVGLNRLLLEVEPETGGARDYRQRGSSSEQQMS
ncbi:MAG: NfeD family protein [Acidimicrobiales bacterium]